MARDEGLEELIRDELRPVRGLTEKPMFGGLAWLLNGHLLCGARRDGLLVRLGKGKDSRALAHGGGVLMQMGVNQMAGWVRADARAYGDDALRRKLLAAAIEFVRSVPAK